VMQLNCTTSPSTFVLYSSLGFSVAHIAAYYDCVTALEALLEFINEKKLDYYRVIDEDEPKKGGAPDTSTKALVEELLCHHSTQHYQGTSLTPFHVAVARGNLDIAKFFVENGGLKVVTEEDLPEIYAGLDVGGQKMDWALDHHASNDENEIKDKAVLIAALYNQPSVLEFLVKDAPELWRAYYKDSYPDRDLPELPDELKLSCTTAKTFYSPLHICCFWYDPHNSQNTNSHYGHFGYNNRNQEKESHEGMIPRLETAKKILELDSALHGNTLINAATKKQGLTPLMIAAFKDNVELVRLLLSHKAIVDCQCHVRGWTALHFAAYSGSVDCVKELLPHFTNAQAGIKSKDFDQTALTVATLQHHHEILKIFIESKKFNIFARDVGGDFALHHAIRTCDSQSVKLLLESAPESDEYLQENGVNQTVLDTAILRLLEFIRDNNNARSGKAQRAAAVLQLVYDQLGYERCLSQYKYIRSITDIMIQQTIAQCEKDLKSKPNRWQRNQPKGKWSHSFQIAPVNMPRLPAPFQEAKFVALRDVTTKPYINFY